MQSEMLFKYLSFFTFLFFVSGRSHYRDKIPNGKNVRDPCDSSSNWAGVGHYQMGGGGPRNPFGQDFAANGYKWSPDLCRKDSDGDGKTNGAELGDPDCEWTEGAVPKFNSGISHPGVCEPVDSQECQQKNAMYGSQFCKQKEECSGMTDSEKMNLTFTRSNVPSRATSYHCQAFEIPEDIHLYATEMIIDNIDVMHHALLYGCSTKPDQEYFNKPLQCGMSTSCGEIISVWTLGAQYDCLHKNVSFPMGPSYSVKYVMLQYHWNNPQIRSDHTDASTMVVYYSKIARKYEAGVLIAGQQYLYLKPGLSNVQAFFSSGPDCSRFVALKDTVYVTTSLFHMHLSGRNGWASQWRDGKFLRYLVKPGHFAYNEPVFEKYNETYELIKGDELRMECDYSTTDNKQPVYYGEGTFDEMCYIFLRVYPRENVQFAYAMFNVGPIDSCTVRLTSHGGINGRANQLLTCNIQKFIAELFEPHKLRFNEFCKTSHTFCRHDCKEIAEKIIAHDCWQGYPYIYMKRYRFYVHEGTIMADIDNRLLQCRIEIEREKARQEVFKELSESSLNVAPEKRLSSIGEVIFILGLVYFMI